MHGQQGMSSEVEEVVPCAHLSKLQDVSPDARDQLFDLHTGLIKQQTGMINDDRAMAEVCKFSNGTVGHQDRP